MTDAKTRITLTPSRNAATELTEDTLEALFSRPIEFGPKDGLAFIPATFHTPRRRNVNVATITALVLDFDKLTPSATEAASEKIVGTPYRFWAYSTHSDKPEARSFRVVFPFSHEFDLPEAWPALRKALLAKLQIVETDAACSDAARLYYTPRSPVGQTREIEFRDGALLDWRGIEFAKPVAFTAPAPAKCPARDETRPVDLGPILEGLKRPGGQLGTLCGRLLRGEALTPPPNRRPVGEPSRYVAWRTVTAHVANILEGWESSTPIEEDLFRPSYAQEVAESPTDFTPWERVQTLFETARANAPEYKAARAEKQASARATMLAAVARAGARETGAALDTVLDAVAEVDESPADGSPDDGWALELKVVEKKSGPEIKRCIANVAHIFSHSPAWKDRVRYNVLANAIEIVDGPFGSGQLTDAMVTKAGNWLSSGFDLEYSEQTVFAQLRAIARDHEYDPVKEYLDGLVWDGKERLSRMLPDYFQTEDTEWSRIVGRKWMISAVARPMKPGCKVDTTFVLEGVKGLHKTLALETLAGGPEFFCTLKKDFKDPETDFIVHSKWIIEFGDLAPGRKDRNHSKAWLTETNDNFRGKYERAASDHLRRCVFAATTNDDDYQTDPTGTRREWPVRCLRMIDVGKLAEDRDQLWAEAVAAYKAGENWWLTAEQEALAEMETEQRAPVDEVGEQIDFWISKQKPERRAAGFTMRELVIDCLQQGTEGLLRGHSTKVGIALKRLKWTKRGRPVRHYPPELPVKAVPSVENGIAPLAALRGLTSGAYSGKMGSVST